MLALTVLALCPLVATQETGPGRSLDFQTGRVRVADDLATIDLPDGWAYLQAADARFVVEDLWGNPQDPSVVGFVAPPDGGEGGGEGGGNWGIVVSYEHDGHVEDSDAASIDFDELLASMQADSREQAERLEALGYASAELVDWAEAPHYDAAERKLYWAKRLQFSDTEGETLNYDVRILGREGVLVLTAVAGVEALAEVAAGCRAILASTEFQPGHRYEEFEPGTDRLAAYGIGGLIAGKALLKAGLFAKLGLFLAKGWKAVALVLAGGAAIVRRAFGGSKTRA